MTEYIPPQQLTPGGPIHGGYAVSFDPPPPDAITMVELRTTELVDGFEDYKWPGSDGVSDSELDVLKAVNTELLAAILLARVTGVDFSSPHMKDTPIRYVRMLEELTQEKEFRFTTFDTTSNEMITLTPIPFYTLCAHHVIPFYGQAHIGYVPDGKLAGLSKFARAVKYAAKGLWVQEELTEALANLLENHLRPQGVIVVLEGEHMCMSMRGVCTPGVITRTTVARGVFADHSRTAKAEFMEGLRDHK